MYRVLEMWAYRGAGAHCHHCHHCHCAGHLKMTGTLEQHNIAHCHIYQHQTFTVDWLTWELIDICIKIDIHPRQKTKTGDYSFWFSVIRSRHVSQRELGKSLMLIYRYLVTVCCLLMCPVQGSAMDLISLCCCSLRSPLKSYQRDILQILYLQDPPWLLRRLPNPPTKCIFSTDA